MNSLSENRIKTTQSLASQIRNPQNSERGNIPSKASAEKQMELLQDLKELIALKDLWPRSTVTSQQLTAYHMILTSVNVTREERRQALQTLSLTSKFFPSVKEIYDTVLLIREKRGMLEASISVTEAWKWVIGEINNPKEPKYPNEETKLAIKHLGGWRVFDSEESIQIIFAHFRDIYTEIMAAKKMDRIVDLIMKNNEGGFIENV